jgi:hypothetical protein
MVLSVDFKQEQKAFDLVLEIARQEENREGLSFLDLVSIANRRDTLLTEGSIRRAIWFLLDDRILERNQDNLIIYHQYRTR